MDLSPDPIFLPTNADRSGGPSSLRLAYPSSHREATSDVVGLPADWPDRTPGRRLGSTGQSVDGGERGFVGQPYQDPTRAGGALPESKCRCEPGSNGNVGRASPESFL